ncbi:hypothetical protein ACET3Z_024614 [Daucus carota]
MDDGGLNLRNWNMYGQHYNKPGNLNLHLFPSLERHVQNPFLGRESSVLLNHNGGVFHPSLSKSTAHMDPGVNNWAHPRDRYVQMISANSGLAAFHEHPGAHSMNMLQQQEHSESPKDARVCLEDMHVKQEVGSPVKKKKRTDVNMEPVSDSWVHRDRFVQQMVSANPSFAGFHEHPPAHSMHMLQHQQQSESPKIGMEDVDVKKEIGEPVKKRQSAAASKPRKPRKSPSIPKENGSSTGHRVKPAKKSMNVVINGMDLDFSSIPIPVCTCTGTPQQCYRWGCGGWQSACCTTTISMYPLPMSTKRRGARIAGRKMSQGAFKKVLEKLAADNYSFANAIDLRYHWARHGTNKFVTIR